MTISRTGTAVDHLLDAIAIGEGVGVGLFAPDAVLDATVPGWRFTVRGAEGVACQFSSWFAHPSTLEEVERLAVEDGEVVLYLYTWSERGVPYAAHHCHRLVLDGRGWILADRFFCGGRWGAARLAEMAAADHAG